MCDHLIKRRIPFAFLEDVKAKFTTTYGTRIQTAIAYAMNDEFAGVLQTQMQYFNGPNSDSISLVTNKLDDVKEIMVQNIETVLERAEMMELLVNKTEVLQNQAFEFQHSSHQLKMTIMRQRAKLFIIIFLALAVLIVIICMLICGANFKKCKS